MPCVCLCIFRNGEYNIITFRAVAVKIHNMNYEFVNIICTFDKDK